MRERIMDEEAVLYEVRCPCEYEHSVKDIQYDHCGAMLGGIRENSSGIFRCPTHGMIFVNHTKCGMEFEVLGKSKIKFKKSCRRVKDERQTD